MNNEVIVQHDQSIVDIAIQHCGSAEAAIAIASLNSINVTDDIPPGTKLKVPGAINPSIAEYFSSSKIVPATALTVTDQKFEEQFSISFE